MAQQLWSWLSTRKQPPPRVSSATALGGLGPGASTLHQGPCTCRPCPPPEAGLEPLLRHRIFRWPGNLAPASHHRPGGVISCFPPNPGPPETLPSVPLEADSKPWLNHASGRGPRVVLPAQRPMGALHPCLHPRCQVCGAQTHVCGLKWTLVPAPPLLTEDLEAGLLTLGQRGCMPAQTPAAGMQEKSAPTLHTGRLGVWWGQDGDVPGTPWRLHWEEAQVRGSSDPESRQACGSGARLWGHPVHPTCRPTSAGWG